jgi:hypothetical protein
MSNIFEIVPNLYISNDIPINYNGNILCINNQNQIIGSGNNQVLNMNIDINNLLIKSNNESNLNINFNLINDFIINSYRLGVPILILSDNLIISVLICADFFTKYLYINILESIYYLCKKLNLNHKMLPINLLYKLLINKK